MRVRSLFPLHRVSSVAVPRASSRAADYVRLGLTRLEDRIVLDAATVVADLQPGVGSSAPAELTQFNGAVYFSATGTDSAGNQVGRELFRLNADGSVELVANINTAGGGAASSNPDSFTVFDNRLLFAAEGLQGRELYQLTTDGQVSLVADVNLGAAGSDPKVLTVFNDKLYFSATAAEGRELYVLNRGGGASLIADLNPGAADSDPSELFLFRGNLYFAATGPNGRILFRESPSGTSDPMPITLPGGAMDPRDFVEFDGRMFFSAVDPADGRELFELTVSNNNQTITVAKVANLDGGPGDSSPSEFTVFDDFLYFAATGPNGREAFRMSQSGAIQSLDLAPGSASSSPSDFVVFDNRIFFAATVGGQRGLFVVGDSTSTFSAAAIPLPAGVTLGADLDFRVLGDELYFAAVGPGGRELYRMSTLGVATLAADINAGPANSDPAEMLLFGNQVYVVATDSTAGRELFVLIPAESTVRIDRDELIFTDVAGVDNFVVVTSDGVQLTLRDENGNRIAVLGVIAGVTGNGTSQITIPLASLGAVENLELFTAEGDDAVIFDLSQHADAILSHFSDVSYDGGPSGAALTGDALRFIGDGVTRSAYTPDAQQTGSGVVVVSRGVLETRFDFSDLEPVDFTGMAEASLVTGVGSDVLTVAAGVDSLHGATSAIVVSGTIGGTPLESGHFFANSLVTIRTGAGGDQITVLATGAAHANTNLTIEAGAVGEGDLVRVVGSVNLAGELEIVSTSIHVNAPVTLGGSASLSAFAHIVFSSTGSIQSSSAVLIADSDANGNGSISMADGSSIDAGQGRILLQAGQSITLGRLVTTNATSNAIRVASAGGGIFDAGDVGGVNVEAESSGAVVQLLARSAIGTAANPLDLAVRNLDAQTFAGNMFLAEVDNLSSIDLQAGAGSIALAAGGAVHDLDAATDVRASNLSLTAASAGTVAARIQTEINTLTALATTGDLYFTELNGLTIVSAVALAGAIGVSSLAGDMHVQSLQTNGRATLESPGGSVVGEGSGPHVTARDLEVLAATGVSLVTVLQRLEARGGSGGIAIENHSSLTVGGIPSSLLGLTGLFATNSDIQLTVHGALTVLEAVQTTGSGAIEVAADDSLIIRAPFSTEAGDQTLTAGRNLVFSSALSSIGGAITLTAARSLVGQSGGSIQTQTGPITLLGNMGPTPTTGAFSGIVLDGVAIDSSSGAITLTGRSGTGLGLAGIELSGGTSITTLDGDITLAGVSVGGGMGSDGLRLLNAVVDSSDAGNVTATGIASTRSGASGHGILLLGSQLGATGTGDVLLAGVGSSGLADIAWDVLTIVKLGGVYTFQDTVQGGQLIVLPGDYQVRFLDGGTITGAVEFQNTGGVVIGNQNSDVLTIAGGITSVDSPTTIQGTLATQGGDITLGTTTIVGQATLLSDGGDVTLGRIFGAGVPLSVDAGSGAVSLANPANVIGDLTITAGTLLLAENDDITQGGAWTVAGATILNSGSHDILLTEPGNVLGPLSVTGANIIITTAADLKVTGASYSGVLNLSTTADLTVSGPVSGNGAANLSAGGEIVFTSTGSIVGEADVSLIADQDESGGGGIFFANGAFIDAGSRTIVLSATDDITLGRLTTDNATAAAIRVESAEGGIFDGGDLGGADLEANSLGAVVTLSAGGPIGAPDAPDAPLDLRVNELVATTGSDAYLEEADGLTVQTLAAPDGSVALTSLTGDIHVLEVLALELATLAAPGGSVVGDGSGPHVTARDLEVLAATGVSLVTVLQRLEARGGTGGIAIENNGSLIVGGIASALPAELTGLSAVESDIQLTVHGALTVLEAVQTTDSGAIEVTADDSLIVRAPFSTEAGDQTLTAGRNLVFSSALSSSGGAISLTAARSLIGQPGGSIQTKSGPITLLGNLGPTPTSGAFSGIVLDDVAIDSSSGAITLTGRSGTGLGLAGIELSGGTSITTLDGDITLTGVSVGGGTGSDGLRLLNAVVDSSGSGAVTATGTASTRSGASGHGLLLLGSQLGATGTGDVLLAGVGSGGSADIAWDVLTIDKQGGVYTFQDTVQGRQGGQLTILPGDYQVRFLDGGTITGAVEFQNSGGVVIGNQNSDVLTIAGGVKSVKSPTTIQGTLATQGGDITLGTTTLIGQATLLTAGGDITLGTTTIVGQATLLSAGGDVTLGRIFGAGVPLEVDAGSGAVSLANPANVIGDLTITAGSLLLAENDDITQGGAWTIAGTTFLNAGVYDILLTEPGNVLGPLSVTGANIIIATAADLKVTGASYSGVLNLSTTADLMVSGPVSGNGAANLSAGGEIVFTSTGSIVGEADVTLIADQDQTGGGGIFFEDGAFIDAGSRTIDLSATDDITLGRLTTTNATAAAIRVTSTAGGILDGGDLGGADLEANALGAVVTLSAGGPIGALDAPDAPLDLRVNELVASTGSDASLEEADGLLVQILAAPDGSVALTSLAGDIHVVEVLALARATLAAPGGSVVGDGSGPHVTARDLEALAATGVSLVTVLQRLEAGGGTGGIAIENNSSLIVGGIPSSLVTGLSATNSDIELTVHGALTVLEAVQTTGSGAIDVAADGSLIVRAPFSTQVGDQTLSAGGDIVFSSAGSVVGEADVSLIADQDQMGGGGIFFANGAFIDAGSRTIILSATDDITLGRLTTANATAAAIRVESASGGIFDGGDLGGADIEANSLGAVVTLVAGGPIGAPGAPLDLRVNELVATTGSDAYLEEADGLTVQTLAAPHGSVALTSLTGDIRVLEVLALERGTLAAPGGSVVGDGSGPHVTARDLEVLAATGVSLVTVLQRLEASGGTRGVAIENNGSLIVGGIASALPAELTGLSAVESDVQLTVHGALTVVEDVQTIGLASILLSADGDLLIDALVKSDTGGQILAANGNLVAAAGAALSTVSGTIRLLPDQDQTGGGTLQFFGDIDVGAGRVVFHINDSASFFAGTVSGAGDLAKLGQGVLEITNASINTYTGTTQLLEGTLRVNGVIGAAQAAGTFFIASDAVLTGAGVVRAPIFSDARTAQIRSSGNLSLGDGSSAGFAFEGELIVGSGHVVTLNDADLAELGVMTMIVSGGRIVAANGVEVGTGDRLAGSGAVSGNIVVLSGGLVSPGASAGALTTNIGDVNLFPGSTYLVEIVGLQPGTQYDQLIVSGSVSVTGATLGLAGGGFRPPDGVVITLIANDGADPVVGRFFDGSGNLLDEGAMVRFGGVEAVVSYQGGPGANDVILTVTGFRFIRTSTGDNLLAPLAIVSDGGGAASQIRDRTVEAPVLFAEPPLTVAFAEAVDQRPAALEAGAAERLRVYFRVVNEATGEEEPREYELDPTYLRDVLVLFRRFKFQDGRYRIYLKEPNSRERLVLDVTIVDGRVVPPNVRDIESQELNPGPTQGESPSPAGAAREAENQGKVTEPGKTAAPSQGAVGAAGVAIAASAARRRLQTLLAGDVPRSRHALRLRQARPR